jgi:putative transposase
MKLVTKVKLITTQAQADALHKVMFAYNDACNCVSRYAYKHQVFNNFSLHHVLYSQIRTKFNLPSQLAISTLSKVADAYKTEITKAAKEEREISLCRFKKHSAVCYDSRILTYGKDNVVSIKTLEKRIKLPTAIYSPEAIPKFKGEADLIYSRGKFYVAQTIQATPEPKKTINDYLGIDLGMVQIATDSDGESYSGTVIKKKRQKYTLHRQHLKMRKTKNSRRRLKKIGDKECRFRKDVNHVISKSIVTKAERTSRGIALENLVQFFDKTRVRKASRADRSSWSFFQLRTFLAYKSALKGLPVVLVNPAYTSQRCSVCSHTGKDNRKSQDKFLCVACGHAENADFNASKNIRYWAAVNQPIAASSNPG